MKSAFTLPIVSGIALAIMAGAAASHYHSVDHMVAFAGMTRANGMPTMSSGPALLADGTQDAQSVVEELQRQNHSLQRTLASNDAALSSLPHEMAPQAVTGEDTDLKRLLAELVTQNRFLRNQVAETNRDLMTLQFQVDTHSEQFRPLKLNEEPGDSFDDLPAIDTAIGVLPPQDLP